MKIAKCHQCNKLTTNTLHTCFLFQVVYKSKNYQLFASCPENAVERLSEHLGKEIVATIGNEEIATERRERNLYAGFVVFEKGE